MSALYSGFSRPMYRSLCLALLLYLSTATTLRAQPLADRVPADALIYVGWMGYDAKGPGYAGSHLQAVMEAGEFQKLADEVLPKLLQRIGKEDQNAAQFIEIAGPILKPMLKHPAAIFIGKPELPVNGQPVPKAGILCLAGADADAMHQHIQDLMKNAPDEIRQMVKISKAGNLVSITVGYAEGSLPAGPADVAKSLAGAPNFKLIQPNAVPNASMMVYVDVEQLVAVAEQAVNQFAPPEVQQNWPKARDVIGLKGVKRLVYSSGFDGKDWADQVFLSAPEPRTGLLALADSTPLSDAALKSIPMTATLAGATKFDLARFIAGIKAAIIQIEPKAQGEIDRAMAEVSKNIGMDFEKDLLATLGDEWIYYTDPMIGGRGLGGIVFANRLKDPAKAEAALTKLEALMNDMLAKNIKQKDVSIRFLTTKSGSTTIHYLGTPIVSPAWAIKDGYLVAALFPQMVSGAIDHLAAGGKSILDNPDYVALRKRLGVTAVNSVSFADLPKTAPDAYATWVAISRLANFSDMMGIPAPAMLMPPLGKLLPHLAPAGAIGWTDKAGIHLKAISPFPGATLIGTDPLGSMQMSSPVMLSILLPSLNRAREQANRIKSGSNLRQIGMAGFLDNEEHRNRKTFTPQLSDLILGKFITPEVFENPRLANGATAPRNPAEAAKWVNENSPYVWLGGTVSVTSGPDTILAYEKPDGLTEGIQVLYADGHVEWQPMYVAMDQIERQKKGGNPGVKQ